MHYFLAVLDNMTMLGLGAPTRFVLVLLYTLGRSRGR